MKRPDTRSWVVIGILGAAGSITPMTVDMTLPALPEIARDFAVTPAEAQLTISAFLIAYAFAQLIYGPLSDRFGRRPVLLASVAFFAMASAGCIFSPDLETLLVGRFIQGAGAAATMAIGRACIRDIYGPDATRAMSLLMMWTGFAPVAAPLLGGVAVGFGGWQSLFVVLLSVSIAIWTVIFMFLDETNQHLNNEATRVRPIARNFGFVCRHRVFLGYAVVTIGLYGSLFAMLSSLPFILRQQLSVTPEEIGLSFATLMIGQIVGATVSARLTVWRSGVWLILSGSGIMLIALALLLSFIHVGAVGLGFLVGPLLIFMLGFGLATPSVYAGVLAPFPTIAGSVSSLMGVIQFISGAILGTVAVALSDGTGMALGLQMIAQIVAVVAAALLVVRPGLRRMAELVER